jgi:lysozyme family protein
MSAFDEAMSFTMGYEGGWANSPLDKGGETYRGISRRFWASWEGWEIVDKEKAVSFKPGIIWENTTLEQMVNNFYKKNFWDTIRGDELPLKMAIALFDCGIDSGTGRAIRLMQIALNVETTGIVDDQTLKSAFLKGENGIVEFLARRAKYIHEIMDNDPTQKGWSMNWFRRLFRLANIVLED